jgi:N-acetylmuramoyl-L-alanine amidase
MKKITTAVIHCTATKEGVDIVEKDIERMHKARGFKTTGYNFVVLLDGSIQIGRGLDNSPFIEADEVGAHALGLNRESIGIVYVGGLDANGKPKDTRTDAQKTSLLALIRGLKRQFGVQVIGHRDVANKECPCYDATTEYKNV